MGKARYPGRELQPAWLSIGCDPILYPAREVSVTVFRCATLRTSAINSRDRQLSRQCLDNCPSAELPQTVSGQCGEYRIRQSASDELLGMAKSQTLSGIWGSGLCRRTRCRSYSKATDDEPFCRQCLRNSVLPGLAGRSLANVGGQQRFCRQCLENSWLSNPPDNVWRFARLGRFIH